MELQKMILSPEVLQKATEIIRNIEGYYQQKVVGQPWLGHALMVSMICNGHLLVESVPGLAKTTAAKVMTEAVSGEFSRIQCTPDLLPSDIIGTQIYDQKTNSFETKLGPVYANFVLLDEINRSSAKTQSAMLEAMQEHQTSIGGKLYHMPEPFVVIATQNPIEQEGTYLLSEAQLDRFLLKEKLMYPNALDEIEILNRVEADVFSNGKSVASTEDVIFLQKCKESVYMDASIKKYIVDIVQASRVTEQILPRELSQYVAMGASTRAAIAFMNVAKAIALMSGRNYCTPDDVKSLRYSVLRHRISLNYAAVADHVSEEVIIDAILGAVNTP